MCRNSIASLHTEVEVRFIAEGSSTRVEFKHRLFRCASGAGLPPIMVASLYVRAEDATQNTELGILSKSARPILGVSSREWDTAHRVHSPRTSSASTSRLSGWHT